MKKRKLELVWDGKDEPLQVEPRILLYDKGKSYGEQNTDNMLIHGDNLLALKALETKYAGQVKCVYIANFSGYKYCNRSHQNSGCCCSQYQIRKAC